MDHEPGTPDWREQKLQEWLLLLLRFAITRALADRAAALAMADELDSVGMHWRPEGPQFFLRTATQVCDAVEASGDGNHLAMLRNHLSRIENPRLRAAFRAAIELDATGAPPASKPRSKRKLEGLFRGLPTH